jgi:hypothetical protein
VQVRQIDDRRWMLVLDRGEELISTVTDFLATRGIRGGFVRGLGALRNHTVAWYDLERQEYAKRTFDENMELGNLTGSVGVVGDKPFFHAHVTVSGPELIAFTGHLVKGEVAVTAELLVEDFGIELLRLPDEEVGLNLFRFEVPAAAEEPDGEPSGPDEAAGGGS